MQNSYFFLLKTSWKYANGERKTFLITYLLFIIANICIALRPLLYGWFINSLQKEGTEVFLNTWRYIGAFFGLYLLQYLFHGPGRLIERRLSFNIGKNFLSAVFSHLLHLPIGWHKNNHSSSIINRLRKAEIALKNFFSNGSLYLETIIQFFISLIAMIYFSPIFGLIGVILGIITVLTIRRFDKPYIRSLEEVNEAEHKVASALSDNLTNIMTVITLKLESQIHAQLVNKIGGIFKYFRNFIILDETKWFTTGGLVSLTYCLMVFGYVYSNYTPGEVFPLGGLVTLIGFVNQFTTVFIGTAIQYNQIVQDSTDVQTTNNIFAFTNEDRAKNLYALPLQWNSIDIKNLQFSYNNVIRDTEISSQGDLHELYNVNLSFSPSQRIALIGASGSGKSTLLTVLKGLYIPEEGSELIIDGEKNISWASFASGVSLFPQQPEIFEGSIRYNITLGIQYTEAEVLNACRIANFTEVLDQLPNGFESLIQENGVNLSGGQKQRLALARGVLACANSNIILMDESTSNIDQQTEIKIYRALFEFLADKVIISSFHRLHLLDLFDFVYVLDKGEVTQSGSVNEIKKNITKLFN